MRSFFVHARYILSEKVDKKFYRKFYKSIVKSPDVWYNLMEYIFFAQTIGARGRKSLSERKQQWINGKIKNKTPY